MKRALWQIRILFCYTVSMLSRPEEEGIEGMVEGNENK
jgi:hypothetical protein